MISMDGGIETNGQPDGPTVLQTIPNGEDQKKKREPLSKRSYWD